MTAGAHEAGGGFGKSAGVNAARGIAVIALAVIVGALLMAKGLDETDSVAPLGETTATTVGNGANDDPDTTVETASTGDDTVVEEETTTPAPTGPRVPAEVRVLVLNGAGGIAGIAGRGTAKLVEAGYDTAGASDAKGPAPSIILYTEGFELEAQAVADVFGIPADTYTAPFDPETSPTDDTQGANIIVRIGNDNVIQI